MAARSFTTPDGAKVRTATKSRFVLILTSPHSEGRQGWIEKRSAKESTLRDHLRREQGNGRLRSVSGFLGDTTDGSVREI